MSETPPTAPLDKWSDKQLEPLGMFELAGQWKDAIKVIGAGNATGVLAAGAALNTFSHNSSAIFWVKCSGVCFFAGVFTFGIAFALINAAVFSYDELLHAAHRRDGLKSSQFGLASTAQMIGANRMALISAITFFLGLILAMIAFLRF